VRRASPRQLNDDAPVAIGGSSMQPSGIMAAFAKGYASAPALSSRTGARGYPVM